MLLDYGNGMDGSFYMSKALDIIKSNPDDRRRAEDLRFFALATLPFEDAQRKFQDWKMTDVLSYEEKEMMNSFLLERRRSLKNDS